MSKLVKNVILSEIIGKSEKDQLAILEKLEGEDWIGGHRAIIVELREKILAKKEEIAEQKAQENIDLEEVQNAIDSGDIMTMAEVIKKITLISIKFDTGPLQNDIFNKLAQRIADSGNIEVMISALCSCIFNPRNETIIAKAIVSSGDIDALEKVFKADAIDPESEAGMLLTYHMIASGDVMAMAKLLEENCCYTNEDLEEKFIKAIIASGNIDAIIEALYRHYVNFKTSNRYKIFELDGLMIDAIIRLGNIDDIIRTVKKIHINGHFTAAEKILFKAIIKSGNIESIKKALEHIEKNTEEGRSLHTALSVLVIRKKLTGIKEA